MKRSITLHVLGLLAIGLAFAPTGAGARQTASWLGKSDGAKYLYTNGMVKIAINRDTHNHSGSEQYFIIPRLSQGNMYFGYRDSEDESAGFSDPEQVATGLSSPPDYDLDATIQQDDSPYQNLLRLAFFRTEGGPPNNNKIKMMTRSFGSGQSWSSESEKYSTSNAIHHVDLTSNRHQNNRYEMVWTEVSTVYPSTGRYRVRYKNEYGTAEWVNLSQGNTNYESARPKIAVFTEGTICVLWAQKYIPNNTVQFYFSKKSEGGTWSAPTALGQAIPAYAENAGSVAWAPDGQAHMVYPGQPGGGSNPYILYHTRLDWYGNLHTETIRQTGIWYATVTAMVIDTLGTIHVADVDGHHDYMKYQVRENGAWSGSIEPLLSAVRPPEVSMALDAEENVHVVCRDGDGADAFAYARKRVWNKEDGGDQFWLPVGAGTGWSVKPGTAEWDQNDFPVTYSYTSGNWADKSTYLYWYWQIPDNQWHMFSTEFFPRAFVPPGSSIQFEYEGKSAGSTSDRLESEIALLDDPYSTTDIGKPAARSVLGNRYPSPSLADMPLEGLEGVIPRALEFRNLDDAGHFVTFRFKHFIQSSSGGDSIGVELYKVWWRVIEQGTLQPQPISITPDTGVSPDFLYYEHGLVSVTITGTGFSPGNVDVRVRDKSQQVISSNSTQITFLLNTDDPDFQMKGLPVMVVNKDSGVFTAWNKPIIVFDP